MILHLQTPANFQRPVDALLPGAFPGFGIFRNKFSGNIFRLARESRLPHFRFRRIGKPFHAASRPCSDFISGFQVVDFWRASFLSICRAGFAAIVDVFHGLCFLDDRGQAERQSPAAASIRPAQAFGQASAGVLAAGQNFFCPGDSPRGCRQIPLAIDLLGQPSAKSIGAVAEVGIEVHGRFPCSRFAGIGWAGRIKHSNLSRLSNENLILSQCPVSTGAFLRVCCLPNSPVKPIDSVSAEIDGTESLTPAQKGQP